MKRIAVLTLALTGCASLPALRSYSEDKAARLLECQAQELTREQAQACLGRFALDIGTSACREAERWLETLPEPVEAPEGRPNE